MTQWADYLISSVRYSPEQLYIDKVKVHQDHGDTVSVERIFDREKLLEYLNKGCSFVTVIQNELGTYDKGDKIFIVSINDVAFIKTYENNLEEDQLEQIPEF